MLYYEVLFDDEYGICIKSEIENPSKEKVADFLSEDMKKFNYTIDNISSIDSISKEEAHSFYDMENEANFPILKN